MSSKSEEEQQFEKEIEESKNGVEKPILRELSFRQVRKMQRQQRRLTFALKRRFEVQQSAEDIEDLDEAEDLVDAEIERMQEFIIKAVVSLPRNWLVDDAPDDINWDDPTSLDWVQNSKMQKLTDFATGRDEDEDAKN